MGKSSTPAQTICWRIGWDDIMGFSKRLLKNPPFTLRQAQGERSRHCNRWRFAVRAEPVEARKRLFQHPVKEKEQRNRCASAPYKLATVTRLGGNRAADGQIGREF